MSDTREFLPWWTNDPLIRLGDYERLQAECEKLRKQAAETSNDILTMADALIIQRTADARDAARYRWLRDNDWRNDEKMESVIRLHLNAIWDEKIDAAMAAQARNKKGIEQ